MKSKRQSAKPLTTFQQQVYEALLHVPPGRATTYSALATNTGCGSARAVGQALRANPFAPQVPCHRVVRADGSIGGFFGRNSNAAMDEKRRLLEAEGVGFDEAGRVEERFILRSL